ncbi:hypothetical protein [Legionella longbeachae]|uniref:hypothetical protein n=1 Tax=Legionella longbeachae TaxID=450 RepID=UPI001247E253|nr:hypothetical protein [Legionella longbeachae]QEY51269.1 hypothetical protein FQU71_08415 [Legionella longbeachae]
MSLNEKYSNPHMVTLDFEIEYLKKKISYCNDQIAEFTNKIIVYRRENDKIQRDFLPYYNKDKQTYHEKIQTCEEILEANKAQIKHHEIIMNKLEQRLEELKDELNRNQHRHGER